MWRVIRDFYDLQDGNFFYKVGDTFPRAGKVVSDDRLAFLASDKNLLRTPVIEKVPEKVKKPRKKTED